MARLQIWRLKKSRRESNSRSKPSKSRRRLRRLETLRELNRWLDEVLRSPSKCNKMQSSYANWWVQPSSRLHVRLKLSVPIWWSRVWHLEQRLKIWMPWHSEPTTFLEDSTIKRSQFFKSSSNHSWKDLKWLTKNLLIFAFSVAVTTPTQLVAWVPKQLSIW